MLGPLNSHDQHGEWPKHFLGSQGISIMIPTYKILDILSCFYQNIPQDNAVSKSLKLEN